MDGALAVPSAGEGTTMRAAVLERAGRAATAELPLPEPSPGQLRVRIEGCGVCGSDLALWQGRPWFDYPRSPGAPGHEGWGIVDALGADVEGPAPGTRVAILGYSSYADFDLVAAEDAVPLPPELDGQPFPGEALACAMNVLERSEISSGQTVAVVGVGFLGALLVQLAAAAGARVIGISRRELARRAAADMGATETLEAGEEAVAAVESLTGGALCERVIEAAGRQETLDLAGRITGVRGRLVIAGFHQDGSRSVDMQTWNWRGIDVINAHERDRERYRGGLRAAVAAVRCGRLDPRPLLTHSFPLERLGDAMDLACERPDGFLKALVTP